MERVRGNIGSGVRRAAYASERRETYSNLVSSLLRLGEVEKAFEVADASQARALQETLASRGDAQLGTRASADDLAEAEELLRRIDQLVTSLDLIEAEAADAAEVPDPEAVQELAGRLTEARDQYEAHRLSLSERHSTAVSLLGIGSVRARAVRRVLEPGEVLVEYLVTPERVIIFAVTRDDVRAVESPISDGNLMSRVRLARDLLGRQEAGGARLQTVLERLHGVLIAPAARAAGLYEARQLVLVSHGILNYLPFAALRDTVTGRYLAQDFSIVRAPSAGALSALRDGPSTAPSGLAREPSATVLVPFPDELPASRAEAESLRRGLQRLTSLLGDRATERQARLALEGDGYVHIATHGVMNARNPLFSRLELYPGESTGGPRDDGRLEVHELLELKILAPLVYLSGCETGLGSARATRFSPGEDYATLAQAFLYAGAGNVLATLWRIDDEAAAVFADRFYRHMRSATPGEALRRTQLEMIEESTFGAPYFWAAYQLSGAGRLGSSPVEP